MFNIPIRDYIDIYAKNIIDKHNSADATKQFNDIKNDLFVAGTLHGTTQVSPTGDGITTHLTDSIVITELFKLNSEYSFGIGENYPLINISNNGEEPVNDISLNFIQSSFKTDPASDNDITNHSYFDYYKRILIIDQLLNKDYSHDNTAITNEESTIKKFYNNLTHAKFTSLTNYRDFLKIIKYYYLVSLLIYNSNYIYTLYNSFDGYESKIKAPETTSIFISVKNRIKELVMEYANQDDAARRADIGLKIKELMYLGISDYEKSGIAFILETQGMDSIYNSIDAALTEIRSKLETISITFTSNVGPGPTRIAYTQPTYSPEHNLPTNFTPIYTKLNQLTNILDDYKTFLNQTKSLLDGTVTATDAIHRTHHSYNILNGYIEYITKLYDFFTIITTIIGPDPNSGYSSTTDFSSTTSNLNALLRSYTYVVNQSESIILDNINQIKSSLIATISRLEAIYPSAGGTIQIITITVASDSPVVTISDSIDELNTSASLETRYIFIKADASFKIVADSSSITEFSYSSTDYEGPYINVEISGGLGNNLTEEISFKIGETVYTYTIFAFNEETVVKKYIEKCLYSDASNNFNNIYSELFDAKIMNEDPNPNYFSYLVWNAIKTIRDFYDYSLPTTTENYETITYNIGQISRTKFVQYLALLKEFLIDSATAITIDNTDAVFVEIPYDTNHKNLLNTQNFETYFSQGVFTDGVITDEANLKTNLDNYFNYYRYKDQINTNLETVKNNLKTKIFEFARDNLDFNHSVQTTTIKEKQQTIAKINKKYEENVNKYNNKNTEFNNILRSNLYNNIFLYITIVILILICLGLIYINNNKSEYKYQYAFAVIAFLLFYYIVYTNISVNVTESFIDTADTDLKSAINNLHLKILNYFENMYSEDFFTDIEKSLNKEKIKYNGLAKSSSSKVNSLELVLNDEFINAVKSKELVKFLLLFTLICIVTYIVYTNTEDPTTTIIIFIILLIIIIAIYFYNINLMTRTNANAKYWNHKMIAK